MKVGVAQVDITPEPGCELSGFAARTQPSIGVLDRLYAKCLYLVEGDERLLWIHVDLIGLLREFVLDFREWAAAKLGLKASQVLISAIHTHSGPATVEISEAGRYDSAYVQFLRARLEEAAREAIENTTACTPVFVEGRCDLAVDRRKKASARTDPRVAAFGWRRDDGSFIGALTNYAMHAVALGPSNRMISADLPGRTAAILSERLPGRPIVLATNGACGNLNPPYEHITSEQLSVWGGQVADATSGLLPEAVPLTDCTLRLASRVVPIALDVLGVDQINEIADRYIGHADSVGEWGDRYVRALEKWRRSRTEEVRDGQCAATADMEIFAVRLGPAVMLGVNAEVFSAFTDLVREATGRSVYTVGYANGVRGYLPTKVAYDEGGYEVETAHFFYNSFRFKPGGLEHLADEAVQLVRSFFA
ncbi:MAG: neutral/alkaline non-lysosomal ceramidase N-terminal domain-containing protein [Phycisphaerae bacterium]|nr:neutral/alkaline non-lysosomal ceramidase N-terminal domain-containing protein [Phycisphaerae bacterium]